MTETIRCLEGDPAKNPDGQIIPLCKNSNTWSIAKEKCQIVASDDFCGDFRMIAMLPYIGVAVAVVCLIVAYCAFSKKSRQPHNDS